MSHSMLIKQIDKDKFLIERDNHFIALNIEELKQLWTLIDETINEPAQFKHVEYGFKFGPDGGFYQC